AGGPSQCAELAHNTDQIARKAVTHVRCCAPSLIQSSVQAAATLAVENLRKDRLLKFPRLVKMPLCAVHRQCGIGGFQTIAQLHQRFPLTASRCSRLAREPDQNAAKYARQMLGAF